MLVRCLTQAELVEYARHVPLNSGHRNNQLASDTSVRTAFSDQRQYFAFARRQVIEAASLPLAASSYEPPHHIRIERGAARRNATDGIGESGQVADFFLEQVADPLRAIGD